MKTNDFAKYLHSKTMPKFLVLIGGDFEARQNYINAFVTAHSGRPVYQEELSVSRQPRVIGKKPVLIVTDWEQGWKKPNSTYLKTNVPTMLIYSKSRSVTDAVQHAYKDSILILPLLTGSQAETRLHGLQIPDDVIQKLKEKTNSPIEALRLGEQVRSLADDLSMSVDDCFDSYFWNYLRYENIDEEPTEFLRSILDKDGKSVFEYLEAQRGNEFFVYASLLNWIEDIIKFCSCGGDYWESAGLVAAKYRPLIDHRVNSTPYIAWIRLYKEGLRSLQSLKINESEPMVALEVFVCTIIQMV